MPEIMTKPIRPGTCWYCSWSIWDRQPCIINRFRHSVRPDPEGTL